MRNVLIEQVGRAPLVIKDEIVVANEIFLGEPLQNVGAQILKEVATQTSVMAGDGTTTATVLARVIVVEGLKAVAAGMNPTELKRGFGRTEVSDLTRPLVSLAICCRWASLTPAKVTRVALQNAVSIAGLLLTIDVAVTLIH